MRSLLSTGRMGWTGASADQAGLAEWVLGLLRGLRNKRQPIARQMHLLETLPLGGKRQLMLVSCAGEHFLVGGGVESIETIVRVQGESSRDLTTKRRDEPCL